MKKGNGKKTLRAVLAAALGMVMLMSLAWAGVTDVTVGKTTNTYTHTYHTNVKGTASIKYVDENNEQVRETTVTHESGFVVGGVADEAVQAEIEKFHNKVNVLIGSRNASKVSGSEGTVFDHFESSNIIDTSGESILVGDTEALEEAAQGGVSKNLDVHEYQYYMITEEWIVAPSSVTSNPTEKNEYTDTYDRRTFALTKGENTFADAGRYFGAGGTMTVQFNGLDTPVSITYSVANDVVTMTVDNYDQLPDGVYSSEYREQKDKMTTTYDGSKLTYNGTDYEEDGSTVKRINETRHDYYTRNHVMVAFTLTVGDAPVVPSGGSSYSGPHITPLLTAPDAKSATDYSGGIYGLTFKSSASFPSFLGVQVDGRTIDKSCYIAEEGSIEVYLKAVYLRTLAAGKHTMTILSSEGDATTEFTIGGLNTAPKTFDAGTAVYGVTAVLSLGGMAWMGKKKEL